MNVEQTKNEYQITNWTQAEKLKKENKTKTFVKTCRFDY